MKTNKAVLIILDGWGIGKQDKTDGVYLAKTPYIDYLYNKYPHNTLLTFGEHVGLPEGQMGNSEVGHLNIGAGRVVFQDLSKINNAVKDGSFFKNKTLLRAVEYAKKNNKNIHLLGLVSKGGVHSSQEHLYALCDFLEQQNIAKNQSFIHAFTDGRDCAPDSGLEYLTELEEYIKNKKTKVASVIGRYYAMDRDKRWERIQLTYNLLVNGEGKKVTSSIGAIKDSYSQAITDEFIKPYSITDNNNKPLTTIEKDDIVICFNYRTDRCREITEALTQEDRAPMKTIPLHYVTMTNYNKNYKNINVVYDKESIKSTIGEVVSKNGLKQIRIAESEKYPHVSFFFSGGNEQEFEGEKRLMVNSPKVATYDLQPEMSAPEVTEKLCKELEKGEVDFVCLNFANGDMVGHTGIPKAIIKACETVDNSVKQVIETGLKNDYSFVIIADHGNAELMMNEDGSPHTSHTTNLVPIIIIDKNVKEVKKGKLADIAPTLLKLMNVEQPKEMTGKILF